MEALAFASKTLVLNLQIKITQGALKKYLSQGLNPRDSTNLRKSLGIVIFKESFR